MRGLIFSVGMIVALAAWAFDVHAEEKKEEVIARVTEAYGGDKLLNLQSIRGNNLRFAPTTTRDTSAPNSPEGIYNPEEFIFDIRNRRAASEFTGYRRGSVVHQRSIFNGERVIEVDFRSGTWTEEIAADSSSSIYQSALDYTIGGAILYNDFFWAWRINQNPEVAEYLGQDVYRGALHDKIQFPFPGLSGRLYALYISTETGLISKLSRTRSNGAEIVYSFEDYRTSNGITYARITELFIGGGFRSLTSRGKIKFNMPISDTEFEIPAGLSEAPESVDTSVESVNRIADGVYHIGSKGAYSLFVDAGDYIIGTGTQRNSAIRFENFKAATGVDKPLRYQVISHFHRGYMRGVDELNQPGTTFVTVEDNVQTIRDAVSGEISVDRLLLVDGKLELGSGGPNPVEIYEIMTDHVDRYLLFYLPAQKLAFVADHLDTPYVDSLPPAQRSTVSFAREIKRLGLDIEIFAAAGTPRLMSRADLDFALERFNPELCLFDRPICS